MDAERLRRISWNGFRAMLGFGLLAALVVAAVPEPGFAQGAPGGARMVVLIALFLLGLTFLSCVVSLVAGLVAWRRGARFAAWIVVCVLILLAPPALLLASAMF